MTQPDAESTVDTVPHARPRVDASVVDRARRGDADAHAELYERFSVDVMTVARRMLGSTARAEDVLQETFVEVIRGVGRFRSDSEIGTWIHRIAINKCLSELRSRWWQGRVDVDVEFLNPARSGTQDEAEAAIEAGRLLDALPDLTRAVLWLYAAEGFTHSEIGRLLGRSESFSKSQVQRACRRLRADREDDDRTGAEKLCTKTAESG